MELMPAAAVPQNNRNIVFRYSRGRAIFGFFTLAAVAAGLVLFGRMNNAWLAYYVAAVLLILLLVFQKLLIARFHPTNWLVRMTDDGLFIKFRSYLNEHFPDQDPTVVFIPYSEIATAQLVKQSQVIPDRDGNRPTSTVRTRRYVELELVGDSRQLADALATERKRVFAKWNQSGTRISTRYQHTPVQFGGGNLLSIEWGVVPGAAKLIEALTRHTLVRPTVAASENFTDLDGMSREEQETRLLELAQTGDMIGAVTLARQLYGYDLTKAKDFIESLVGAKAPRS